MNMKHLKLFEDFDYSPEEYTQMMDKYTAILNDKAVNIKARITEHNKVRDIELEPEVTVWGYAGDLNQGRSYTLHFTDINKDDQALVSVTILNDGRQIVVFKNDNLKLEDSEISKILRMVDQARDYIGGVDLPRIERELLSELRD